MPDGKGKGSHHGREKKVYSDFQAAGRMTGIPFWGSAIETLRMLPVTACQPPFGSSNKLAGGADSPRNLISAQTESDKRYYVNPRLAFTQTWTFPRP